MLVQDIIGAFRAHWRYRDLVRNLIHKDMKVRFHGTSFGFLWSFVMPLTMMGIYYFVFSTVFPNNTPHFALYLVIGVLHYNLFNQSLMQGCESLVQSGTLLQKIYFPRVFVPLSNLLFNFILWCTSIVILLLLLPVLGGAYSWYTLLYFLVLAAYFALILGVVLTLAVLSVEFRDLRHLVEVGLTVLFWVTPIVYDPSSLAGPEKLVLRLNPLFYYFTAFHDLLYRSVLPDARTVAVICALSLGSFVCGTFIYWRRAKWLVELL